MRLQSGKCMDFIVCWGVRKDIYDEFSNSSNSSSLSGSASVELFVVPNSVDIRVSACRGKNEKVHKCDIHWYTQYTWNPAKKCWVMPEKLLISQKQSPRKEIRHSGFYAFCAVIVMFTWWIVNCYLSLIIWRNVFSFYQIPLHLSEHRRWYTAVQSRGSYHYCHRSAENPDLSACLAQTVFP